jgi:hypothetical protein
MTPTFQEKSLFTEFRIANSPFNDSEFKVFPCLTLQSNDPKPITSALNFLHLRLTSV